MEQTIDVLDKVGIKDIDHYISSICELFEQSNSFQTMNSNRTYQDLVFYNDIQDVIQFSSVAHSCPTLCNPMDCSMPGLPVHHQLPEFTQTRVH